MKINSLKITVQDVTTSDGHTVAGLSTTLFIDDGEFKMQELEDGTKEFVLDKEGEKIPMYEIINASGALGVNPDMKRVVQELVITLLTMKNLKIAKKNGELTHFVEAIKTGATDAVKPKVTRKKKK